MLSRNDELDHFKREINLAEYAAGHGFRRDSAKSTRHTYSMEDDAGNHLVISVNPENGHWRFFNPVDPDREAGSIIDFIQSRDQVTLGEVRKILRDFLRLPTQPVRDLSKPQPAKKSRADVVRYLEKFEAVERSSYAESRGIHTTTLTALPFRGRILKGYKGALIFPHWDEEGLCGYEVKAFGFTSFSSKGFKSLWVSRVPRDVQQIVVTESGIEALSYFQEQGPENTLFVSAGGNWSASVSERLKTTMARFPQAQVVGAFNNDPGGKRQSDRLKALADEAGSAYRADLPSVAGADWNDMVNGKFGTPKLSGERSE